MHMNISYTFTKIPDSFGHVSYMYFTRVYFKSLMATTKKHVESFIYSVNNILLEYKVPQDTTNTSSI